jgi:hypothetical protein
MPEYELMQEIIRLSQAATWREAKLEWELAEVFYQQEPDTCLCGHFPINEICVLRNRRNGHRAEVGNVCVKKFLGLPSDEIFRALSRVAKDETKALNAEAVGHAHERSWINDWEREFYLDTMRLRKLSNKQLVKRKQINRLVLRRTRRTSGPAAKHESRA